MKKSFLLCLLSLMAYVSVNAQNRQTALDYASEVREGKYYLFDMDTHRFINPSVNPPSFVDGYSSQPTTLTSSGNGTFLMSGISGRYLKLGTYRTQNLWADGIEGDTYWTFTLVEGQTKVYGISALEGDYTEATFTGTWYMTACNATNNAEQAGSYCLIGEESLEDFCQQIVLDIKLNQLYELIIEAESMGIDISDAKRVYDNFEATENEIDEAIAALQENIRNQQEMIVSPSNPLDVTDQFLLTSTFEENFDGWLSTTGAKNNQIQYNASIEDGEAISGYFWENWKGSAFNGKMYTQLENLPNGIYSFSIGAFTASGEQTFVYANEDSAVVGITPEIYTVMPLIEDGKMEVGLKTYGNTTQWMGMDNANLVYYGNVLESYQMWYEYYKSNKAFEGDDYCQESLYQLYLDCFTEVEASGNRDDMVAAITRLLETARLLQENIAAYKALQSAITLADQISIEIIYDDLYDYLIEHEDDVEIGELSTEEAIAVYTRLLELIELAHKLGTEPGGDCTDLLANPDFSEGINGWTIGYGTLKTGGNAVNPNAESWQENFDIYQEITGLNNGVYQMDFNAFSRSGDYQASWLERHAPKEMAFAYMNGTETTIADYSAGATKDGSIYTSPDIPETGYYVPNNLDDVARGFNSGLYQNTAYGIVTNGILRVGIYSQDMGSNCWVAWDNIKLTYQGKDDEVLKKALPVIMAQMEEYLTQPMCNSTSVAIEQAIAAAQESLAGDAITMFDAYTALESLITQAQKDIAVYTQLLQAFTQLEKDYNNYQETASSQILDRAKNTLAELETGIKSGSYTLDEIDNKIEEITEICAILRIPKDAGNASDESPVDMTSCIVNPSFDNNDDEGWTGTPMTHQNVQASELFNKDFDIYQSITNLPNGRYRVSVTGFYRNGWNEDTHELLRRYFEGEEPVATFLYAITEDGRSSVPLTSIWDGASEAAFEIVGELQFVYNERTIYAPNSMAAAVVYFENELYKENHVTVDVTDGTLTIGLKKDVLIKNDWTMFDNFRLIYYGTNSQHTVDGDPMQIEEPVADNLDMTNATYYDLSGRLVATPTRGIYVVRLSNGHTIKQIIK